jgi:hypothetical protein
MRKIKLTHTELLKLAEVLKSLNTESFVAKTAYVIMRLSQKISPEVVALETARLNLYKKYGKFSEDGKRCDILDKNIPAFQKEHEKLFKGEVEIETEKLKVSDFGDVKLKPGDLLGMAKILSE